MSEGEDGIPLALLICIWCAWPVFPAPLFAMHLVCRSSCPSRTLQRTCVARMCPVMSTSLLAVALFVLACVAHSVLASKGVDFSAKMTATQMQCLHAKGYAFAVTRVRVLTACGNAVDVAIHCVSLALSRSLQRRR